MVGLVGFEPTTSCFQGKRAKPCYAITQKLTEGVAPSAPRFENKDVICYTT